jgi:hypothetical protein
VSGLGRVIVGYREHDRRRYQIADEYGYQSVAVRKCAASCGYPVYFVTSGIDTARAKDAEVLCDECFQRYRADIYAEL